MSCCQWPGNGVHDKPNPKNGACRGWRSRDRDLCMQISPRIIYTVTRWSVNCASHSQYNLRFFRSFSLILRSWTAARLARCLAARNEAAPNTRTSQLHKDPPNVFFFFFPPNSFCPPCEFGRVRSLFRSSLLISGSGGVAKTHQVRPRAQKWEASLPADSSIFLPFPLFLQLRLCSPWSPRYLPHFSSTREKEGRSQASILKATLGEFKGMASGRLFPHPRVCKLFTFISKIQQPRDLTSAQAHPVCFKKATAFPSPRRPREQ